MFLNIFAGGVVLMLLANWTTMAHGSLIEMLEYHNDASSRSKIFKRMRLVSAASFLLTVSAAVMMLWAGYEAGLTRYAALEGVEMPVYQIDELFMQQDAR